MRVRVATYGGVVRRVVGVAERGLLEEAVVVAVVGAPQPPRQLRGQLGRRQRRLRRVPAGEPCRNKTLA